MITSFKRVLLILCLFISTIVSAQEIKGIVTDSRTGEPLIGANVLIKEIAKKKLIELDGKFAFKSLPKGKYTIIVSFPNYKTAEKTVTVDAKNDLSEVNFSLETSIVELQEVRVNSGNFTSEKNVRNLEKNANELVHVFSAKNIQLLPDITVANVLQRVSSVTVEKNSSGEARYPIIRGMEKRYINTLVNGIKIPSPDNKSRFIPLDLFPSELLERLEVSKSLTPSMEGDAIGGTIDLIMKDAPVERIFVGNVSAGYNNIFNSMSYLHFDKNTMSRLSPAQIHGSNYIAKVSDFPVGSLNYNKKGTPVNSTIGLTYGDRFGKDKKLGVIVSGSYQNIFSGTQSTFFLPDAQPNLNNLPSFVDLYYREYSTQNQRLGLNAKLDYKFNGRNKISLINTFVRLDQMQTRVSYDTVALNSLVTESYRSIWQYQSIYNTTLQGVHQIANKSQLDWSAGYSIANNHIPDQAQFSHQYPVSHSSNFTDVLQTMSRVWLQNSDKDFSAYVNSTTQASLLGKPLEIKIGAMIRDKNRDNFYNSYSLNPLLPANSSTQSYTNINSAIFTFIGSNATPSLNGNNYTFNEVITAGYLQGKWKLAGNVEFLGGVRVEHTYQKYNTDVDSTVDAKSGKIYYTDFLPSGQFKIALNQYQNLRLAYYRAIARPQFAELIPFGPDNYETFKEVGNPYTLKHTAADNLELRYELFPKGADQLLLGVFYKRIQDPIEFTAVRVLPSNQLLKPNNIGTAANYGFEAVFTKYIGVFGISANYTFTQSKITNDSMLYYYRNAQGNISTKYVSETRPLQGQSNHIGSVSLIYKNAKNGLDAQIGFVYTGERIALVSPYAGLHYWQQPQTSLDFSFEKRIVKRFTLYGKMNNLANAPIIQSLHIPYNTYINASGARALSIQTDEANKIIVLKNTLNASFIFGVRYKF